MMHLPKTFLVVGKYRKDEPPVYMEGNPSETLETVAYDIAYGGYNAEILAVFQIEPGATTIDVSERVRDILVDRIIDGMEVGERGIEFLKSAPKPKPVAVDLRPIF